jgi:hypothetical protein
VVEPLLSKHKAWSSIPGTEKKKKEKEKEEEKTLTARLLGKIQTHL